MIKVKYINDNNEPVLAGVAENITQALKLDYSIWRDLHKECIFEYRGHFTAICQEDDFIDIEKYLEDWIKDIDDMLDKCLEFNE